MTDSTYDYAQLNKLTHNTCINLNMYMTTLLRQ